MKITESTEMDQIGNRIQPEPAHHRSANFLKFQKLKKKVQSRGPKRTVGRGTRNTTIFLFSLMRCIIKVFCWFFFDELWQFSAYFSHSVYFGLSSNRNDSGV